MSAAQKDAVLQASIDFIASLTGMKPPPIEIAPPEVFAPFKEFADKVCAIFTAPQPAEIAQEAEAEPVAESQRQEAYTSIDRLLRNHLDDEDYACFSESLETVFTAPQAVNAELLVALNHIKDNAGVPEIVWKTARAALAKAT